MKTYQYRPQVIEQLWRHGVHPKATTPPRLVYDFVNDLYRYELRRLRSRLLGGEIARQDYYHLVVQLRVKYPLVSFTPDTWVEGGA